MIQTEDAGRMCDRKELYSKVLNVISEIRGVYRNISIASIVIFLRVCENDGISVKDLIYLSGYTECLVSRSIDSLSRLPGSASAGPAFRTGLIRVAKHPSDGRRRLVYLTDDGRLLRDRIRQILIGG